MLDASTRIKFTAECSWGVTSTAVVVVHVVGAIVVAVVVAVADLKKKRRQRKRFSIFNISHVLFSFSLSSVPIERQRQRW